MAPPPRRYLVTEQQVLAAVDAVVTLPGSAVAALVQHLEARPELAPGWLQQRPQATPQQHECPECEEAHTQGYREGRALERERAALDKRKLKAALTAVLSAVLDRDDAGEQPPHPRPDDRGHERHRDPRA